MLRTLRPFLVVLAVVPSLAAADDRLHDPRERHLADVRQLTSGGENAEAYWSSDGDELIFQRTAPPYGCDQIFRLAVDRPEELELVSTGEGRTTCAFFFPDGERVLYSSTHLGDAACPPRPDFSQGYVWPIYPSFDIFTARPDGSDLVRLTTEEGYDAEATVCSVDGSIVFTSTRDGDLELYRMNADGSDVRRLTEAPGYDGGAFFSPDCERIVWRASRPTGDALADYRRLLAEHRIRPGRLELWVADADGGNARQVTYLGAASFAPYFHPSGERILFSTNYSPTGDGGGREFDIWAIDVDGSDLERITYTPGFDGFPMFSPDGEHLAFSSNRNQGKAGETDVYVARWVEGEVVPAEQRAADRLIDDVAWLAADERQGRGAGTAGLEAAARWLAERFADVGLEAAPGAGSGAEAYLHPFDVPIAVRALPSTAVAVDGAAVPSEEFTAAAFSASASAAAEVVPVGYGITAPELHRDDYHGLVVEDRIVVVRRFTPEGFDDDAKRRFGDLRYKAYNAREHGAAGVIIVDLPEGDAGDGKLPDEARLPRLRTAAGGDAGLPVVVLSRAAGAPLFAGGHRAELEVALEIDEVTAYNVVGRLPAGTGDGDGGAVLVGAHYDHLGMGGAGSLAPDAHETHNGADDNASGTAALLEIARLAGDRGAEMGRDLWIVAFAGEEAGLLGSTHLTRNPPPGLAIEDLAAMLNLDMVGRLRDNRLSVLGSDSAAEWNDLVSPLCNAAGLDCALGGDGYGPSDQTPFYAAGVPVLHFFTGTHADYHKPTDDTARINASGLARIASLVADVAVTVAARDAPLTHVAVAAPPPPGDARSFGASLGTIPDYAGDGRPGVLLADTRPDGAAATAGMRRGDLLVELAGHEIRDIYDMMFVLRQSKPGQEATAVVIRDDERVELAVTFGESRGIR